ncbi:MAG: redox-sensing transcriptional repressor Rex [Deltaproteobacteria bacterium]|nr:redox-sensing transcriptional repressor Rex [Deltaproteobacteria bacterium]
MKREKIPAIVVTRLSIYLRSLAILAQHDVEVISSGHLADMCGINPAQIRRDLSYFGEFGVRGVGYYVNELLFEIRKILGLDKQWRLALVGVGNLGLALLKHPEFQNQRYTFVLAFEKDPKKIGTIVEQLTIAPLNAMNRLVKEKQVEIGVITATPEWAQKAADSLVRAGVRGILNFAPLQLKCPGHVFVEDADFTIKSDALCYKLTSLEPG